MTQPPPVWPHAEISQAIDLTPEDYAAWKARSNASYDTMRLALASQLYGDHPELYGAQTPFKSRMLRQRVSDFFSRAHDAWLVLLGRADIC